MRADKSGAFLYACEAVFRVFFALRALAGNKVIAGFFNVFPFSHRFFPVEMAGNLTRFLLLRQIIVKS